MKNYISTLFLAAAGALCLAAGSCSRLDSAEKGSPAVSDRCSLSIHIDNGFDTRSTAASAENERAISGVQVLVFDENGVQEAYGSSTAASKSVTVSVVSGQKKVWAVANCSDVLSGITSEAALSAYVTSLSSNSPSGLLMAGSASASVSSSSSSVAVPVSHLCAKVTLRSVKRDFENATLAAKSMSLKAVYLINVPGQLTLGGAPVSGGTWYNCLGHKDSAVDALLYDSVNLSLADGGAINNLYTYYPYPNSSTSESTSPTWSERRSMIVLECLFDGEACYYPIFIPTLERNKICEFTSVTLTRRGSDTPYEPVSSGDVTVTVTVTDFVTGESYTETI